ncbi:hypothetical protein GCM10027347_25460 [Larkinella harenae]
MFVNGFIRSLAIMVGLAACNQDDGATPCQVVEQVTAQSQCYEPAQGLTLTASGHNSPQSQISWFIFPQDDTTSSANMANSRAKL